MKFEIRLGEKQDNQVINLFRRFIQKPWLDHGNMCNRVIPCLGHGIDIDMCASVRPCLGHGIGHDMRANVRSCLGHGIDIDMCASVRPCLGHGIGHYMRANVRACLGHGIGIDMCASVRPCLGHRIGYDMGASVRPCLGHGIGEHRRVKRVRNGPKKEKMGQCRKSTRPGLPYMSRPHARVFLADSNTAKATSHGRVTQPYPCRAQV
ncbi:Glycerol-1-phosphate dehydrogenase [NAD(P)+] [Gossypium arboreum]|uniref:Glycerol-1-phosphate dehydrogenase [NAD(P)+] n=1 Tax=Gossypium arboreum TaxID=29729 RepID=A0A0B0NZU7_GOSAR|nr:Glycerol-1-phosphate dehydrogenase [NAD(P)+] [Gossypium arboreum]